MRITLLVDHFTQWQDAIGISDAKALVAVNVLYKKVFCYFELPEQIHTNQGAQFESQLMTELCHMWGVQKTRTITYYHQM